MSQKIIQINFQFQGTPEIFTKNSIAIANIFAQLPGLRWKIWLMNEERNEAGGIYLFANDEFASNYLQSDLLKMISNNSDFSNVSIKQFDTLDLPGLVTNAPVKQQLAEAF